MRIREVRPWPVPRLLGTAQLLPTEDNGLFEGLACLPEGSPRGPSGPGFLPLAPVLPLAPALLLNFLAPRLAGPQHRRHRPRQLVATATRAIFFRPGSPCMTRSKNAFTDGLRRTACHAASHSSIRAVAGPSPVMWPRRSLPAELSWHGTRPR